MKLLFCLAFVLCACTNTEKSYVWSESKHPSYSASKECASLCILTYGTKWTGCNEYDDGKLKDCYCE